MGLPDFGGWTERYDALCAQLDELNRNLREFPRSDQEQHSRQEREWQRFILRDGAACVNGTATVGGGQSNFRPAPNGWEAYVTSVAVTVSGASAAATVANYIGGVDDMNLFDYANQMLGNSPSRVVGFYDFEVVHFEPNQVMSVVVAGAVSTANVIVRVMGKRRQT